MAIPDLIYCDGSHLEFVRVAVNVGFKYGAQLPGNVDLSIAPLFFADQNWKKPQREVYMQSLSELKPFQATVLDMEREEQYAEVLDWAEEASQFVTRVIIIPKVFSIIPKLPYRINGTDIVLGYSVPTKYAGTQVPVWEFGRRPVHLLGGSPQAQMYMAHYLNVVSADSNYANKMAACHCQFWVPGTADYALNRYWPTLREFGDGKMWESDNCPRDALEMSCHNIMQAWVSFWN